MNFFHKTILIAFAFFAAVLLCGKEAHAATEFVSTIRATGGDYSLLSTWEAATQCNLTASTTVVYSGTGIGGISAGATLELFRGGEYQNITVVKVATTSSQLLVQTFSGSYKVLQNGDQWRVASSTNNMWTVSSAGLGDSAIAVAECYNDWPTGLNDNVTVAGWTINSTNYIKVYAPESERHSGKAKDGAGNYTGFAIKKASNFIDIVSLQNSKVVIIDGLILDKAGSIGRGVIVASSGYSEIKNNIILGITYNATSPREGISVNGPYTKISNNIIYSSNGAEGGIRLGTYTENTFVYNNTIIGFDQGFVGNSNYSSNVFKNCLGYNNTTDFAYGVATGNYNASSDDTADDNGGTGNRINQTFTFVDEANDDFHLSSSDSGAKNQGADLSGDGSYPITDDIDYQTRPYGGIWDIGADETPSSAFKFNGGTFKIRGSVKFE